MAKLFSEAGKGRDIGLGKAVLQARVNAQDTDKIADISLHNNHPLHLGNNTVTAVKKLLLL